MTTLSVFYHYINNLAFKFPCTLCLILIFKFCRGTNLFILFFCYKYCCSIFFGHTGAKHIISKYKTE